MKSTRKKMTRDHVILLPMAFIFTASSALVNVGSSHRYNGLLQDYQQINGLLTINSRKQTYFKPYSKSHDEGILKQYCSEYRLLNSQLRGLDEKMRDNRKCKTMYRIVGQAAKHRWGIAELYIQSGGDYYPSPMADLDEVDLEIERCLSQLISQYLEYLNTASVNHSRTLGLTNSIPITLFMTASLFGMVLNHQMSTNILSSIERLADTAKEITNNNLEVADVEGTPYAELNQVSATLDQVKRQIRAMTTELHRTHRMKERLAEARVRELQTQMNPRFLFSALGLVICNIQLGERDISIQLVKAVSEVLQSSIEINTVSIPLDTGIELLQSCLYIQKLHLKGRVTFCLDICKSFMDEDIMIPPLTVQPLVGNSIQHGLKGRVNGGKVNILITEKPDYIEAVVAGNGVGFPEDSSRPTRRDTPAPKTSIGPKNVGKRLRLFYRRGDVLHIQRMEGVTKVMLKSYKSNKYWGERVMLRIISADSEQYEWNYLEKVIRESHPGLLGTVYKAVDGMDLMEKLKGCKPQIVLLDIKMPRMNGLKTAEGMRKRHSDIQIVPISVYSDFFFAKQAIKLGVTDCLLKPCSDSEFRETLDKVIAKVKEREDTSFVLSHPSYLVEGGKSAFGFYQDLGKDLLWDVFFGHKDRNRLKEELAIWGVGSGWFKIVLISSPTLISMGGFSQEVLKDYFHMAGVMVPNNIWTDRVVICLYSQQQDGLTELTGYITRVRDYLIGERRIPIVCGISGTYEDVEQLTEVYGEAASSIREYSAQEARPAFDGMTRGMKRICGLEEQTIKSLSLEDQDPSCELPTEAIKELETLLGYQDISVKLNFSRGLMTVIRGVNQIPDIRVRTSEAARRFEKLGQLNFSGDNLKYHVESSSEMKIQRE